MLAATTEHERRLVERASRLLGGSNRYVDLAAEVVAIDGDGWERVGGKFDTVSREFVGPPETWSTWKVGSGQMPPLRSRGRFVVVGAMGAGKTEIGSRWAIALAILSHGKAIGVVAPTQKRLRVCWQKIMRLLQPAWVAEVRLSDGEITLVNGCRLQFVAAKIYSKDVGSPIQGYSWVACLVDEEQDVEDEAMADVMMRGRDADRGEYHVLSTCTLKDTPRWRDRKERYESDPNVVVYRMEATANPFVDASYWRQVQQSLTPRQYRMRVLALDARPDRATYQFSRDAHVRPRPMVGAKDVTRHVVGADMLIGHDPGELCDVSIMLRCFDVEGRRAWWVVDELTTERTTSDQHVAQLLGHLNATWKTQIVNEKNGERTLDVTEPFVHVRVDPHDAGGGKPYSTVIRHFRKLCFDARPAVYRATRNPALASKPGVIRKEERIDVINTLLENAAGQVRLYVDCDDRGIPCAPKLVEALEMSERDEGGNPETQKKDRHDLSHWPSALGFALYSYERARIGQPIATAGAY